MRNVTLTGGGTLSFAWVLSPITAVMVCTPGVSSISRSANGGAPMCTNCG